jgi:hypothetical protein
MTTSEPPSARPITLADLATMLAPTLGQEKSEELLRGAAAELGLAGAFLEPRHALAVVDRLGGLPGMVGVAARFVRTRYLEKARPPSSRAPSLGRAPTPTALLPPSPAVAATRATVTRHALVHLLVPSLGKERGDELVTATARRLGLAVEAFDKAQALALFDALAELPGIVGVAARFSKARVVLLFLG